MDAIQEQLCIACAADENYAMPLVVTLTSALMHFQQAIAPARIFILSNGIAKQTQAKIAACLAKKNSRLQLHFVECNLQDFAGLPTTAHITVSMYLRLLLAELLPTDVCRIIYLDSDVLIEKDLADLWEEKIDGYALAAVTEFAHPTVREALPGFWSDAGLDAETPAFCSGMLLINLEFWRQTDLKNQCVQFARTYASRLQCPDQDALNAIVNGNWKRLDPRWDSQFGTIQAGECHPKTLQEFQGAGITTEQLMHSAYITHFVGPNKPWITGLNNPLRARYHRYLKKSGWFSGLGFHHWTVRWFISAMHLAMMRAVRSKIGKWQSRG